MDIEGPIQPNIFNILANGNFRVAMRHFHKVPDLKLTAEGVCTIIIPYGGMHHHHWLRWNSG